MAEIPAGPDNNIRGLAVESNEVYFANSLHFK